MSGPRPRLAQVSLGCRVSRADADDLAARLGPWATASGDGAPADVVVVHTCTVTGDAEATARQAVRRAAREHPGARIVVAGCAAEASPAAFAALPGVAAVVGARRGDGLAEAVARVAGAGGAIPGWRAPPPGAGGRARPLLKVQDGCDAACAYCAVPAARGPSRSLPFDEAVARLLALGAGGGEVVLTGVHLGRYGRDLRPARSLEALVAAAVAEGLPARVRLSSIEPLEVPLGLLRDPATAAAVCPHLHLPLQSGSARVLAAMGRPYDPAGYRAAVQAALALRPDACVGADVIAGFPGETAADHRATLELVGALPLAYLHVFTYSPRPGTRASDLPDPVAPAAARARAAELRAVSAERWRAWREAQVGRVVEAVVERVEAGVAAGTAADGVRVRWAAGPEPRGARCAVRVAGLDGPGLAGERAVSPPAAG